MKSIFDTTFFVLKDLIRDGWRTFITVVNLIVFISCYFALISLAEAAHKFADQPTDRSALIIVERNVLDPSESIVTQKEFSPAEGLVPKYVKSVTPLIFKIVKVDNRLMQLRAARVKDMQEVQSLKLLSGTWPERMNEIVIGESTAVLTGWKIGDTVEIYGGDFKVAGLIEASGTKFSSIWMNLDAATKLFNINGNYQFAWIQLQPGVDGETIRQKLQANPEINANFDVYFADNLYQQYASAISDLGGLSTLLVFLALFAIMLGTYSNIFLLMSERSREITILRAIGFSPFTIRLVVSLRSLLQTLIAYLFSWLLSSVVLGGFNTLRPLSLHSIPLKVEISTTSFVLGLILAFAFTWLGVMIPTRHLRQQSVSEVLLR